jgi:hypothetical protein
MTIIPQAAGGGATFPAEDDPNGRLEAVVRRLAHHPDPVARYVGAIGVVCDLSLQRNRDGLHIAADTALDFLDGDEVRHFRVRAVQNSDGQIAGFDDVADEFPADDPLIDLVGVIALLKTPEARETMLRAASMAVIAEPSARWAQSVSSFLRCALQPAYRPEEEV